MIKKNKETKFPIVLVITSIVCLLPICLSLAVYNDLPESAAMQWNFEGNPNWYAHKAVLAFGMPLFFMALNIIVFFLVHADPKHKNASKVMLVFVEWFISVLSLIIVPLMLLTNLDVKMPTVTIVLVLVGILFVFLGNYMPKNKQNYYIGIRVSWTLNDPENWNKTHRMGGFLWIIGGILTIITAFLPLNNIVGITVILIILLIIAAVPILYSYSLYKKEKGAVL
ncbi:MAG: SdpI family protein [Treponema sp.]|nr:SdpI family protein [Treponema sp.]